MPTTCELVMTSLLSLSLSLSLFSHGLEINNYIQPLWSINHFGLVNFFSTDVDEEITLLVGEKS